MKIYEKPMALIENIEVEDVITVSVVSDSTVADVLNQTAGVSEADATVIFEW